MTKYNYKSVSKQLITCLAFSSLLLVGSPKTHAETTVSSTTQTSDDVTLVKESKTASEAIFSLADETHNISDKLFMLVTENEDKDIRPLLVKEDDKKEQVVAFKVTDKDEVIVPETLLTDMSLDELPADIKLIELSVPEEKLDDTQDDNVYLLSSAETVLIQKQFSRSNEVLEKNLDDNYEAVPMMIAYDDHEEQESTAYAMRSLPNAAPVAASGSVSKKEKSKGVFAKKEYAQEQKNDSNQETASSEPEPNNPETSKYTLELSAKEVTLNKGDEQPTSEELKDWFTAVNVVEGGAVVKNDLEDYTVTLINPKTVDTEVVGISSYDVKVEGNYEGNVVSGETRVRVEIEDGKGKGEGDTPPPNKDKPEQPTGQSDEKKDSDKKSDTLPQTGESLTHLLLPLGIAMVSVPVIFVYLRK